MRRDVGIGIGLARATALAASPAAAGEFPARDGLASGTMFPLSRVKSARAGT
jgi:hypothetical protein